MDNLYDNELHLNNYLVFILFDKYPDKLNKVLQKIDDDFSLFEVCKLFISNKNSNALEVFRHIKNKSLWLLKLISLLKDDNLLLQYSKHLLSIIDEYNKGTKDKDSKAISDIAKELILILTKNERSFDEAIKIANTISSNY